MKSGTMLLRRVDPSATGGMGVPEPLGKIELSLARAGGHALALPDRWRRDSERRTFASRRSSRSDRASTPTGGHRRRILCIERQNVAVEKQ